MRAAVRRRSRWPQEAMNCPWHVRPKYANEPCRIQAANAGVDPVWSRLQIALGRADLNVPKVGRQLRQQAVAHPGRTGTRQSPCGLLPCAGCHAFLADAVPPLDIQCQQRAERAETAR